MCLSIYFLWSEISVWLVLVRNRKKFQEVSLIAIVLFIDCPLIYLCYEERVGGTAADKFYSLYVDDKAEILLVVVKIYAFLASVATEVRLGLNVLRIL